MIMNDYSWCLQSVLPGFTLWTRSQNTMSQYELHNQRTASPKRIRDHQTEAFTLGLILAVIGTIVTFIIDSADPPIVRLLGTVFVAVVSLVVMFCLGNIYVAFATRACFKDRNGEILHTGDRVCVYRSNNTVNIWFCGVLALDTATIGGTQYTAACVCDPQGVAHMVESATIVLDKG
jgi:hypothetical protein